MEEKDYETAQSLLPKELRDLNSKESYRLGKKERFSEDGSLILCTDCGKPKKYLKEFSNGKKIWLMLREEEGNCDCLKRRLERDKYDAIHAPIEKIYNCLELRESIGRMYVDRTFDTLPETDRPSYKTAVNACKIYCNRIDSVLEKGQGMYLYSPNAGNGKTTLMACVRNSLLERNVPCVLINVAELMNYAGNRNKQTSYSELFNFNMFSRVSVLILDDIGAIDLTKNNAYSSWVQTELYELLEARNRNNRCTCFTSNYNPTQLRNERGYDFKTVDRILERSTMVMELKGDSFRG